MSNVPFANVKDNIVEKEEPAIEEVVVATSGVVVAPSGGSLHEEFMKSALAEADSYVEAWEQKESQVYSIDQTIDSNVYAESFIVREKVPETKQTGTTTLATSLFHALTQITHQTLKKLRTKLGSRS